MQKQTDVAHFVKFGVIGSMDYTAAVARSASRLWLALKPF